MSKLIDLCDIQYGYAFDSNCFTDDSSYPQLVRIRDVKRGYSETFYTGEYPEEYVLSSGDLLIGMDGEFNIARWKVDGALLNQRVCKVIAKEGTNEEYIRFFLLKCLKKIEERTSFATVKHLSAKELNKIEIETPSIDEQANIASSLGGLEKIIELRKQELSALDDLIKARFVELFEDAPTMLVENVCDSFKIGPFGSALHKNEMSSEGFAFVLGTDNAVKNEFAYKELRYIDENKYNELGKYTVVPGDVIMSMMGTVGRVAVIPKDMGTAIISSHLCILKVNKQLMYPEFFHLAFCKDDVIQHQIDGIHNGSIMKGFNLKIVKAFTIKCPSLDEQKVFLDFVKQVDKSKVVVQKSLEETQVLFDSLMQKYFG